jgi:hypothetical protein
VPRPAARRGSTVAAHAEAGRRAPGPARGARNRGPPHALRGDPRSSPPTNRRSRSSAPRLSRRATRSTGRPSANPASGPTPDRRLVPVGLGSPVALLAQPPRPRADGRKRPGNRTGCRRTGASAQPGPEAWACRRTPRPTPAHPAAEPFERRCLPADLDRPASRDRCHHRPEPDAVTTDGDCRERDPRVGHVGNRLPPAHVVRHAKTPCQPTSSASADRLATVAESDSSSKIARNRP